VWRGLPWRRGGMGCSARGDSLLTNSDGWHQPNGIAALDLALAASHRRTVAGGDPDECGRERYAIRTIAVTACWRCVGHHPCNSVTARSGTPD
jgi:hypothetical protein